MSILETSFARRGPVDPSKGALKPLPGGALRLVGGYWHEWQERNAAVVLRHCEDWMERIGWIGNFDAAALGTPFEHAGIEFVDSEVYKLLEAMASELGRHEDPGLARRYDALVDRVADAQDPDGYLDTSFGRPWQPPRWSNLEWGHELYCAGHLLQAAVARIRTVGSGLLVDVARRLADHLVREFGDDGRVAICGHPEIETALVEFGRATGDDRYIRLAKLFIDRRGHGLLAPIEYGQEYFQDDVPVRDADVLRGHAVRALYLAAGAVDVAVETGDDDLLHAVERQWERTVGRRTYITGAMGSHHQDEAFGADWELPPDREYGETCAAVASNMLSWRLLLQSGDARYADLIERTLFNAVMVAPREDGRAFFYANTLHQRTEGATPSETEVSRRALSSLRAPWFEVSCCPTNLARTLASVESMFATMNDDGVQLHQYGDYDLDATLANGATARFSVRSAWPSDGVVRVTARTATEQRVGVTLRIPGWADGAVLTVNGTKVDHDGRTATVARAFAQGDVIELTVPMHPTWNDPDPRVDAVRGTRAVTRGPVVYALESIDAGDDVGDVVIDDGGALEDREGVTVRVRTRTVTGAGGPFGPTSASLSEARRVRLVPYASWGNRGPSTMRVYLPAVDEPAHD